jgi:hypothetical protein
MTPEDLTKELQNICKDNLKSVILFGSAAMGDHVGKNSDYNVLVVVDELDLQTLSSLSDISAKWAKCGNPAPMLFTWDRLRQSADVFPIELADIKENNRILFGENPLADIEIDINDLRNELEHELKGKLISLRNGFLLSKGNKKEIRQLMIESVSAFLILFRASLRLHDEKLPPKKIDAVSVLKKYVEFDVQAFNEVWSIKEGNKTKVDAMDLFKRYLQSIETLIDSIDSWIDSK